MKKINAWINKLFGVGTDNKDRFSVGNGEILSFWPYKNLSGYGIDVKVGALKEGSTIMVDHDKRMMFIY